VTRSKFLPDLCDAEALTVADLSDEAKTLMVVMNAATAISHHKIPLHHTSSLTLPQNCSCSEAGRTRMDFRKA